MASIDVSTEVVLDGVIAAIEFMVVRRRSWTDTNGNHAVDPGEEATIDTINGAPLPDMADLTASMWMAWSI